MSLGSLVVGRYFGQTNVMGLGPVYECVSYVNAQVQSTLVKVQESKANEQACINEGSAPYLYMMG